MSLFKRALGAVGAAGAAVTNKYIDEQLAQQRAQFMADLQRQTAGQIRSDDLAFRTDPGNLQRVNDATRTTTLAQSQAQREAEMAGMNDAEYQGMRDAQAEKDTQREVSRAGLLAEARAKAEARFRPSTAGGNDPFAKLPPAVRASYQGLAKQAEQINAAIVKAQADGMWEPDKNKSQSDLLIRQRVLKDKAQELLQPYIPKQGKGGASPDDDIRALLMGDGAAGSTAAGASPAGAPEPPPGPLAAMDDRTLQRLATIEGHANQAKAIEELRRRGKWQDKPKQADGGQAIDYSSVAPT
jgi:hypothetical protein